MPLSSEPDIVSLHRAIARGEISVRRLIEQHLDRIHELESGAHRLHAILTINDAALRDAERLDGEAKQGHLRGPLHGIPVIVKDNIFTADMPTSGGCAALSAFRPPRDAEAVARLRRAGAVILAKANLQEFALGGLSMSSLGGQVRNPYDRTRTAGGSSGGTAAAIASGMAVAGVGSDTVNSVRSPSSATALAGLRPTHGLISADGVIPVSPSQDTLGPIARNVIDAALLLEGMAERSSFPDRSPAEHLSAASLAGVTLGLFEDLFGNRDIHPAGAAAMEMAVRLLREQGAEVMVLRSDGLESRHLLEVIDTADLEFVYLFDRFMEKSGGRPSPRLRSILESGRYHHQILDPIMARYAREGEPRQFCAAYRAKRRQMRQARRRLQALFDDYRLDAVIYPLQQSLVARIGDRAQEQRNGILAAATGSPALTVAAGYSPPGETAPLGIPIGMDILGRRFDDAKVLAIGARFERAAGIRRPPAP